MNEFCPFSFLPSKLKDARFEVVDFFLRTDQSSP